MLVQEIWEFILTFDINQSKNIKNIFNNLKVLYIFENFDLQNYIDLLILKLKEIVIENKCDDKKEENKILENKENKENKENEGGEEKLIELCEYLQENISGIKLYYDIRGEEALKFCLNEYNKNRMSKIYDILNDSPIQFDLNETFKKYEIFINCNLENEKIEKKIGGLTTKKNEFKNEIDNIKNKIYKNDISNKVNQINNEIECLNDNKNNIMNNHFFLIPFSSQYNKKNNMIYTNKKNNICKNCKYNCHINCEDYLLFKSFCGCFDWSFRCKNCPNKCSSDKHELLNYKYANYDYKTIKNILSEYNLPKSYIKSKDIVSEIILRKKKEIKEIIKKRENELTEEIKKVEILIVEELNKKKKNDEEKSKLNIYYIEKLLYDSFEELNFKKI